jgi:uroporphyrinogen-III synthase
VTPSIVILSTKKLKSSVAKRAADRGYDLIQYDFIKTVPLDDEDMSSRMAAIDEWLIFTSRQAVKIFATQLKSMEAPAPVYKIYCLQGETMKAVKKLTKSEICGTAKDAAALANLIVSERRSNAFSFICGKLRRDDLMQILTGHGIVVTEIQVYDTVLRGKRIEDQYQGIAFFSPSAVESYFQTNILAQDVPAFCIGKTTAAAFREHSHNKVVTADEPSQEMVMEAVHDYFLAIQKKQV